MDPSLAVCQLAGCLCNHLVRNSWRWLQLASFLPQCGMLCVQSNRIRQYVQAARDNSYVGTFGEAGYGIKAQQVLGQVRAIERNPVTVCSSALEQSSYQRCCQGIARSRTSALCTDTVP